MSVKEAVGAALALLAARSRSRRELEERLLKRGFSPGDVAEALTELEKKGYLDDRRFALSWAKGRLSGKPMGRARLRQELKAKGLRDEDIEEALKEVYAEADELQLALMASERKLKSIKGAALSRSPDPERSEGEGEAKGLDPEKRRQKLFRFLKRRGFPPQTIWKALGEEGRGEEPLELDLDAGW